MVVGLVFDVVVVMVVVVVVGSGCKQSLVKKGNK